MPCNPLKSEGEAFVEKLTVPFPELPPELSINLILINSISLILSFLSTRDPSSLFLEIIILNSILLTVGLGEPTHELLLLIFDDGEPGGFSLLIFAFLLLLIVGVVVGV